MEHLSHILRLALHRLSSRVVVCDDRAGREYKWIPARVDVMRLKHNLSRIERVDVTLHGTSPRLRHNDVRHTRPAVVVVNVVFEVDDLVAVSFLA